MEAGRKRASAYSADAYVRGVLDFLDEFDPVWSCWR